MLFYTVCYIFNHFDILFTYFAFFSIITHIEVSFLDVSNFIFIKINFSKILHKMGKINTKINIKLKKNN